MAIQSQAGSLVSQRQPGGTPNNAGGTFGEGLISGLTPRYYSLVKNGRVFSVSSLNQIPTAYVGAAAGAPVIGLWNPQSSGVDLVLLQARTTIRTTGTTGVAAAMNFWAVNQGGVAVTGAQTLARNMYSQVQSGSAAYATVGVFATGALAATLIAPSISISINTPLADIFANLVDDINGAIVVPPGCFLGYGLTTTTSCAMDTALIWAEIPV